MCEEVGARELRCVEQIPWTRVTVNKMLRAACRQGRLQAGLAGNATGQLSGVTGGSAQELVVLGQIYGMLAAGLSYLECSCCLTTLPSIGMGKHFHLPCCIGGGSYFQSRLCILCVIPKGPDRSLVPGTVMVSVNNSCFLSPIPPACL